MVLAARLELVVGGVGRVDFAIRRVREKKREQRECRSPGTITSFVSTQTI